MLECGIHRAMVLARVLCLGCTLHGAEEAVVVEESPGRLEMEQEKGHGSMLGTGMMELAIQLASVAGILLVARVKGPSSMLGTEMRVLETRHANAAGTCEVEQAILRADWVDIVQEKQETLLLNRHRNSSLAQGRRPSIQQPAVLRLVGETQLSDS